MQYLISGYAVKIIAGLDDTMVHIPVVGNITKTKQGRIAFAIGIFLAITLAIALSFLFASGIRKIPYYNVVSAGLIFFLAFSIYFNTAVEIPKKITEKKLKKIKRISTKRFAKLMGIGFITAFATVVDDTIAYSSLFLKSTAVAPWVIAGIFLATITQLIVVVSFSQYIRKIKYRRQITTTGMIILGFLIFFQVL